jgi:hypothetical protein
MELNFFQFHIIYPPIRSLYSVFFSSDQMSEKIDYLHIAWGTDIEIQHCGVPKRTIHVMS